MAELLSLFGVSVLSALFPVINVEAYLGVRGAIGGVSHIWLLSAIAGIGQMAGKIAWYWIGANATSWGWIRKKAEQPKAKARLELWRSRTHGRPIVSGLVVFGSAVTGFPPFAIISVLAGQLRMNVVMFFSLGFIGRTLRFAAVLGSAGYLTDLLKG